MRAACRDLLPRSTPPAQRPATNAGSDPRSSGYLRPVPRKIELRELLIGIEGLALLRHLYDCSDDEARCRVFEVRSLLDDDAFATSEETTDVDARTGYRSWSHTYDEAGNPIVGLEEPVVWSLLEKSARGRALDAACGTGRHARRLVELGHDVTGIDLTPEMLGRARSTVPGAQFIEADLSHLPARDGEFHLVVCGLALAHVIDLHAAVAELGRVLADDGCLVASVLHPFQAFLGWHAPFEDEEGRRRFVREHTHTHADYLSAMRAANLVVTECFEPTLSAEAVNAKRRAVRHIPDATLAAYVGLPAVLIWAAIKANRVGGDAPIKSLRGEPGNVRP